MGSGATVGNPPGTPPTVSTALPAQCTGASTMAFSKEAYSCADPDTGTLAVADPNGGAVTTVSVTTASGDSETLALSWSAGTGTTPSFNVPLGNPDFLLFQGTTIKHSVILFDGALVGTLATEPATCKLY